MYKQIIIARKDLNMSPEKLAVQVAHASSAFLLEKIKDNSLARIPNEFPSVKSYMSDQGKIETEYMPYKDTDMDQLSKEAFSRGETHFYTEFDVETRTVKAGNPDVKYKVEFIVDKNTYEQWIDGNYVKTVLAAKDLDDLLNAILMAGKLGMRKNKDIFLIYDNCHTELKPEESGDILTCIGFRPMDSEEIGGIVRKYQLYE